MLPKRTSLLTLPPLLLTLFKKPKENIRDKRANFDGEIAPAWAWKEHRGEQRGAGTAARLGMAGKTG